MLLIDVVTKFLDIGFETDPGGLCTPADVVSPVPEGLVGFVEGGAHGEGGGCEEEGGADYGYSHGSCLGCEEMGEVREKERFVDDGRIFKADYGRICGGG